MIKKPITPEKRIENHILLFLEEIGVFAWKNQSTGIWHPTRKVFLTKKNRFHINGVSDILGLLPDGSFLAIEVKSARGKATEEQTAFLCEVNKRGGVGFIARSVTETISHLSFYLKKDDKIDQIISKWQRLEKNKSSFRKPLLTSAM